MLVQIEVLGGSVMPKNSWFKLTGVMPFVALLTAASAHSAEVEPKSSDVTVYAEPTNKSTAILTLKAGEKLEAIERKGMFWQVKTKDGKPGFVSVLQVKHRADASSDLTSAIKGAVKNGRSGDSVTESRVRSAVMGVRGLREDDSAAKAGDVRPNLRAVYDMEDKFVSAEKISELGEKVFQEVEKRAVD